ncbi:Peptidase S24-like protein [uncultured archaeon]|nr:Peptidase S24-like protein [uncultured archaeon]
MPEALQFKHYNSIIDVLKAIPHDIIIASFLLAIIPFLLYKYRKKIFLLIISIAVLAQKFNPRNKTESDAAKLMKNYYETGKSQLRDYFFAGMLILIFILVGTQSVYLALVTTESMRPYINRGDLVIAEGLSTNFSVGDIIEIQPPGYSGTYVHRVVRKLSDNEWKTKGDNWNSEDGWTVTRDIVKGKVITMDKKAIVIPYLGIYLMPTNNVALSQDPTYNFIVNFISTLRTVAPVLILIIFILIFRG